jgi:hypothetical protein
MFIRNDVTMYCEPRGVTNQNNILAKVKRSLYRHAVNKGERKHSSHTFLADSSNRAV